MKPVFRRFIAVALALALLCGGIWLSPVSADTKSDLQSKLAELEKKETKIKNQLADAKSDLSASQKRKNLIDSQIDNAVEQINMLDTRLENLDKEIADREAAIAKAEEEIKADEAAVANTRDSLGKRLRAVAKTGNVSTLQMLLNTENYTEYLLRSKVMHCVAEKDQSSIDALQEAMVALKARQETLANDKETILSERAELVEVKKKSDSKKKELDTLYKAAASEVRNLQSTVSGYNSQLAATRKEIAATDAAIEALIKKNTAGSTGTYNGQMMYWPVPTVRAISSVYGNRWGTIHKGIDIANGPIPIYGQSVYAAADGKVIYANSTNKWGGGYGYYCIVDHGYNSKGQNVCTLYAHCSVMYAKVGQVVTGGKTVLAKAGNTGNVTGPHLHFEVRINGKQVNPLGTYVSPNVN